MNKDRIEGATQKAVGAAKDAAGKVLKNDKLRAEGAADKVIGSGNETVGKVKDAMEKASKR